MGPAAGGAGGGAAGAAGGAGEGGPDVGVDAAVGSDRTGAAGDGTGGATAPVWRPLSITAAPATRTTAASGASQAMSRRPEEIRQPEGRCHGPADRAAARRPSSAAAAWIACRVGWGRSR